MGANAQEAEIAGRAAEALTGGAIYVSGSKNFNTLFGSIGELLQFTGGTQGVALAIMFVESNPELFVVVVGGFLALAGGLEMGDILSDLSLWQKLMSPEGQPFGADLYDLVERIRLKNKRCGRR